MTDPTAPVTPRTEAMQRLRDHLAILRGRAVRQWMDGPAEYDVREIDAAIAASDAIEREAGGTDALRAALERIARPVGSGYKGDVLNRHELCRWMVAEARAALAASDAGPAGIDVERVRQVLDSTKSCTDKCDHEGVEWTWSSVEAHAERFAAEYERLRRGVK
jgi:Fe-S cluster assembly ATPase SufC